MQVDYEDAPAETSFMSGRGDDEEPEDEETEQIEDRPKKRRPTKSRQSLAEKAVGTTLFPLARVKRIIKSDKDLDMMSSEATFLIAVATEYFIKHFMEEGYTKARLEQRRIVNYRDMANVVSRSDEFDFLRDVVPLPIPLSEALELRKAKVAADEAPSDDDSVRQSADDDDDDDEDEHENEHEQDAENTSRPRSGSRSASASASGSRAVHLPGLADSLPPLERSTNPAFPNAIVKRPPNTHPRGPVERPKKEEKKEERPPATPKLTGKNAPSTPHSLTTRRSARRSQGQAQQEPMQVDE